MLCPASQCKPEPANAVPPCNGAALVAAGAVQRTAQPRAHHAAHIFLRVSRLACIAPAVRVRGCRVWKGLTRYRTQLQLTSRIDFLVDADTHSILDIKSAISILQQEGGAVETKVFAEPARDENKMWRQFFRESDISFRPVPRGKGTRGEANDSAIVREVKRLSKKTPRRCIALMTQDTGFSETIRGALAQGNEVLVVTPIAATTQIREMESAGARVVTTQLAADTSPKVRAVLHEDGSGTTHFAEPFVYSSYDNPEVVFTAMHFMQDLGYREDKGYLVQSIAKFWFTNGLGPLTVFPGQCANKAVCDVASKHGTPAWTRYTKPLAFFLPVSSRGKSSKGARKKFGSTHARAVFKGDGPFILRDSSNLVAEALESLGYMDRQWNTDLSEAMLTFLNVTDNKKILRKQFEALPSPQDTMPEVRARLRSAFLSNGSDGEWRIAPKDTAVRKFLHSKGLLGSEGASRRIVFRAMKKYAKKRNFSTMQNYNTYVSRILGRPSDPNALGSVEFSL
ncbi:unnamed protein product [Symbiodinium natans]|uniref:NYN domain-containing protein n=1 Tax=Symbiodinium natans TaxID=878477 RepID=A0A812PUS9_9DINO|nr:unnamed protein product [Symbiodinium natans]